jgi:hypothetical protein
LFIILDLEKNNELFQIEAIYVWLPEEDYNSDYVSNSVKKYWQLYERLEKMNNVCCLTSFFNVSDSPFLLVPHVKYLIVDELFGYQDLEEIKNNLIEFPRMTYESVILVLPLENSTYNNDLLLKLIGNRKVFIH